MYDDLLTGLGDGMAAGLVIGLGEPRDRHRLPAQLLRAAAAECVGPRQRSSGCSRTTVLRWGDRIAAWYVREQDLRGWVPGKGWAHAVAHGADAIGVLARSPHLRSRELTVLLDVLADRLLLPAERALRRRRAGPVAAATLPSCTATWSR